MVEYLILSNVDPPGLLVDGLFVPLRVDGLEVDGEAVVLASEQEVVDAKGGGLAVADIT